jgi:hypothetical protein
MGLIDIPDPISIFESAKTSGLERQAANAFVSSAFSGYISFLWTLGKKTLFGLGPALQDMATAQYLTLSKMETKGFLTLSVPSDMLTPENVSRFQTEWQTK